jgi:hypothetical protein
MRKDTDTGYFDSEIMMNKKRINGLFMDFLHEAASRGNIKKKQRKHKGKTEETQKKHRGL